MNTKTITGLTLEQNKLACFILDKVYDRKGDYAPTNNSLWDFKQKIDLNTKLTSGEAENIIKLLEFNGWIIPQKYEGKNLQHKISDWAWSYLNAGGSFISHYKKEQEQKKELKNTIELDKQIKELTKIHLEKSIKRMKLRYTLFTIGISGVVSIIISTILKYI
ncbi:hypothetical protein [Labilibaculum euxinus]|uniref:Uncharacterized protein n=1 Tax=Labilibaculum euxinus TaxID=2686357 RepID=A0A7M4D9N2_9BACT|nr:hypothetical protein [Labilibaculum euxinus]MUP39361.1 hypothetical protein [Labilibaculum euxinus]MVB08566.1 hypothetical protein [Labilibaculum euxinus]